MSWQFNESVFSCLNFVFPDIYKLPTTDHFCCQQRFDREPDIPWNSPDSYCRYLPFHYQQSFTKDIILNNFGRCLNIIDCFFFTFTFQISMQLDKSIYVEVSLQWLLIIAHVIYMYFCIIFLVRI